MRIDAKTQFGMDQLEFSSRAKKADKKSDKSAETHTAPLADALEISGAAKKTAALTQALKDLPDVRQSKVAQLKARIESGTYHVSGKDIAEKIVNTALNGVF